MKKVLFLISIFINFNLITNDELFKKIQAEYQNVLNNVLTPQDHKNFELVSVNQHFNPTLFGIISSLAKEMEVKTNFNIFIYKGNDITKKSVEIWGKDLRSNACANGFKENASNLFIGEELFKMLNYNEFIAIITHELAHIKFMHSRKLTIDYITKFLVLNYSSIGIGLLLRNLSISTAKKIGLVTIYSLIAAPYAVLTWMAKSRNFEFEADAEAIKYIGNKQNLINGVAKIENAQFLVYMKSKLAKLLSNFSTHPLLENRAQKVGITN